MNGPTPWDPAREVSARPMNISPFVIWLLVAVVLLLMSVPRLMAQDTLATARSLYASAAYDEALRMLQQIASESGLPPTAIREAEEYRFLCLLALGRNSEARESIGAVVTADPLYQLDENNTSPRVLNAFRDVRRELLPGIVQSIYTVGKGAYDRSDYRAAELQLRKVVALSADPDLQGQASDLGALSKGFLDLAVAALATPTAPAPVAPGASPAPAPPASTATDATNGAGMSAPTAIALSGSAAPGTGGATSVNVSAPQARAGSIVPPVIIKQTMPPVPGDLTRFGALRGGELELLIDETGKVQQARFIKPIHPIYDGLVMQASRNWRYEPATADGVPVKFRKTLKLTIAETPREQQQQ